MLLRMDLEATTSKPYWRSFFIVVCWWLISEKRCFSGTATNQSKISPSFTSKANDETAKLSVGFEIF
jgi:hypothetical protein